MTVPPTLRYLLVRSLLLAFVLLTATATATGNAFARDPVPSVPSPAAQSGGAQRSPAANDAVQVVNDFMAALVGGRIEAARQLMSPEATVLANGNVLGDRDGYINGAAKADAAALATVERELLRRDVKTGANFGWVVSETSLRQPGAAQAEVVTETMLLARTADGWKITHIHWSGRHAG